MAYSAGFLFSGWQRVVTRLGHVLGGYWKLVVGPILGPCVIPIHLTHEAELALLKKRVKVYCDLMKQTNVK